MTERKQQKQAYLRRAQRLPVTVQRSRLDAAHFSCIGPGTLLLSTMKPSTLLGMGDA